MATAAFTTVEARVDQVLTNAIWADEIKDNINQLAGAHSNLLTNGGFEIWQRGAGAFTASAAWTADRWQIVTGGSTVSITKETGIIDAASVSSCKYIVSAFTVAAQLLQKIEDFTQLRGREVSFSCRVYQDTASRVRLQIIDSAGTTSGSTSATTNAFVTLTVTRTINAAATSVQVGLDFNGTATAYFDNAMLVIGPAPAPYQPLHPQEDMARCQRYYEVHGGANPSVAVAGYGAAGATASQTITFNVLKGGSPTLTKNGTWGVSNCGQPTVGATSATTYALSTVITTLGTFSYNCNSADDTVSMDWAP